LEPIEEGFCTESEFNNDDDVLLNVDPRKLKMPKDQIFIDFFGLYTKKFVEEQKSKKMEQMPVNNNKQQSLVTQDNSSLRTTAPQVLRKARMGGNQRVRLVSIDQRAKRDN
jgi:hypothetical protein